jgi:Glycosyl hydrolase family 26
MRRWLIAAIVLGGIALAAVAIGVPLALRDGGSGATEGSAAGQTTTGRTTESGTAAGPLRRLSPPRTGVYLGVSNATLIERPGAVDAWKLAHGRAPRIVNWFQQWLSGERRFRADWARRVAAQGAVPMITWEPWYAPLRGRHTANQPAVRLSRIAAGADDRYIRSFAREVAAYRGPVLIRLMHEMNGNWYPWGVHVNGNTPADYVAAWRHVHDIFRAEGARNVSWIWSINNLEGPSGQTHDIARYYPGDRYVDWVSTSGFNWGNAYSWSSWRDADGLYGETYRALERFGKPIMISEIGTTDDGGDPTAWIRDTLSRLREAYPRVHAIVWYDAVDDAGLDFRLRGPTARTLAGPAAVGTGWLRPLGIATLSGGASNERRTAP